MDLELLLQRLIADAGGTDGELFMSGVHEAWTLERPIHDPASGVPYGKMCAIAPGRYKIELRRSPHFGGRWLPHICDVPGRECILIHPANKIGDLEGCVGVGHEQGRHALMHSLDESNGLVDKLTAILSTGAAVWIDVRDVVAA